MENFIKHFEQISTDNERCSSFCLAYVALARYFTLCDGMPSDEEIAQQEECKALFLANESLAAETKASLEALYAEENPIFFKARKYLDAISTEDLTVIKTFVEQLFAENDYVTEQERIALDKFVSYYDERTDKWHWERSTEKWNEDIEALMNYKYTPFSYETDRQSNLKKGIKIAVIVIGVILAVRAGVALAGNGSGFTSLSEMSDKDLLRKIKAGIGKNTGETVSGRAQYIIEAYKRGLTF